MTNAVNVPQLAHSIHPSVQLIEGRAVTSSVEVARVYGKQHRNVIRDIEKLMPDLGAACRLNFEPTEEIRPSPLNGAPIKSKAYHLTRDGFTLLAMGFTGKKALAFKLAYIEAFNHMEAALTGKPLPPPVPTKTLTFTIPLDEQHSARWLLDIDRQGNERCQHLALQALPDGGREGQRLGQARGKGADDPRIAHAAAVQQLAATAAQTLARFLCLVGAYRPFRLPVCRTAQFSAHGVRDIAARTRPAHDKTVAVQLQIGILHGIAGQPQGFGQGAGGGQFRAGAKCALQNQRTQGALDAQVQVQRLQRGFIQADFQGVKVKFWGHAVCLGLQIFTIRWAFLP